MMTEEMKSLHLRLAHVETFLEDLIEFLAYRFDARLAEQLKTPDGIKKLRACDDVLYNSHEYYVNH